MNDLYRREFVVRCFFYMSMLPANSEAMKMFEKFSITVLSKILIDDILECILRKLKTFRYELYEKIDNILS